MEIIVLIVYLHCIVLYTPCPEKKSLEYLDITSSNTDRFLKFFYCHNLQEICNKAIVKYPTTP